MNYNHNDQTIDGSTGVNTEELSEKVKVILQNFMQDDDKPSLSHLTQELEENLTPRELAVLATQHTIGAMKAAKEKVMRSHPLGQLLAALSEDI